MASSPSSTIPPRTPITKKPVPNTPQQSPLRLKTDNLSISSSGGGYGSAGGVGVESSLPQMSPDMSPVSPLSAGSVASWRREDIGKTKEEEGVDLDEDEEEPFQAQVEEEVGVREEQRGVVVVDRLRQSRKKIALEKQGQNEQKSDQSHGIIGDDQEKEREDDKWSRQGESEDTKRNTTMEMDVGGVIIEEDLDAGLYGIGRSNDMGTRIERSKNSKRKGKQKARAPSVGELLPREIIQM